MTLGIQNFQSNQNYTIVGSTSSQNQAFTQRDITNPLNGAGMSAIRVANNATGVAFVRWGKGAQAAVAATDDFVLPGEDIVFNMGYGNDNFAVILPTGTGNIYVGIGNGS